MQRREQLPLPFVAESPDPRPHPDRRQAVAVERKPAERERSAEHPNRDRAKSA